MSDACYFSLAIYKYLAPKKYINSINSKGKNKWEK